MYTSVFRKYVRDWAAGVLLALAVLAGVSLAVQGEWLAAQPRVVAVGDIHGIMYKLVTILQRAGLIDARHRWVGGNATLVQTGDFLDRGTQVREVMDLLMELQKQAPKSGGRVVVLLGNHEVMNIMGDLQYVTPEIYASFGDNKSEKRLKEAYKQYIKFHQQRDQALNWKVVSKPDGEEQWMETHPSGFLEHREAFGPKGKYGRWLRSLSAVIKIGDAIFLHGGIDPDIASFKLEEINRRIKKELEAFDRQKDYFVKRRVMLPFFTRTEMFAAAQTELEAYGGDGFNSQRSRLVNVLTEFLRMGRWLSIHSKGPLWFRGFAQWPEETGAQRARDLLQTYKAAHFVVGHTTQVEPRILMRFDGKVFLIDTLVPSALEIQDGKFTAIYSDTREVLFEHGDSSR
ncbi:metallophosphoesterase [Acidobacteria bacterium AH-259-A15]|nr:metallophosphoesterase [Acidobacteria bacterium AH-259-A15]